MRTFPTFRCTCPFVYGDIYCGGFLSRRGTDEDGGSDGAADEFQPFPSRHRVFVSAEEPMVTIRDRATSLSPPFSLTSPRIITPPLRL